MSYILHFRQQFSWKNHVFNKNRLREISSILFCSNFTGAFEGNIEQDNSNYQHIHRQTIHRNWWDLKIWLIKVSRAKINGSYQLHNKYVVWNQIIISRAEDIFEKSSDFLQGTTDCWWRHHYFKYYILDNFYAWNTL